MTKSYTYVALASAVFRRDIRQGALGPDISSLFLGRLKVTVEGDFDEGAYTYLRKPGHAVIHVGFLTVCSLLGVDPCAVVPEADVRKVAKVTKTVMEGLAYHECGHLLQTDMTGEAFDAVDDAHRPFLPTIKKGVNHIEDPAMEHLVVQSPYHRFMRPYFRHNNSLAFPKAAKAYSDDGSFGSLLWYVLLYLRVGPRVLTARNAFFESMRPKGILDRLRGAYRERDAKERCRKQVAFVEWLIDEFGLKADQQPRPMEHERPVIIVVDKLPNGKTTQSKLQPQDGQLPPVSVVEAGDGGEGGEGELPDADVIDLRKAKDDPSEGEGEEAKEGCGEGDLNKGGDAGEGSQGAETGQRPSGSDAGDESAPEQPGGVDDPDLDWETGDDDPVLVLATDGLNGGYDRDLDAALRVDAESNDSSDCFRSKDSYDVRDAVPSEEAFDDATRKQSEAIAGLASALDELKDESAPTQVHGLPDGEELCVEDYIETIVSGDRSFDVFVQEAPGREITDLAVSLLVDCSGSMSGRESLIAHATSCMVAMACEEAQVPVEISAFSTGGMLLLKEFDEDLRDCVVQLGMLRSDLSRSFSKASRDPIGLWGGTDLEGALPLLFGRLRKYEGKACKLAFVITDGDTGDPETTGRLVAEARGEGIVVVGIGIGTSIDSLRTCFDHCESFDFNSLERLPMYVANEIRAAMASAGFQGY